MGCNPPAWGPGIELAGGDADHREDDEGGCKPHVGRNLRKRFHNHFLSLGPAIRAPLDAVLACQGGYASRRSGVCKGLSVCSLVWRMRSHNSSIKLMQNSEFPRNAVMKDLRSMISNSVSISAMASAVLTPPSITPISPNISPEPMVLRTTCATAWLMRKFSRS